MKLDSQTFKLLIDIVEQADPNITYSHLKSNLGKETANNLIQNNYFNKGRDLETYYLPGQDREAYVEWSDDHNSFVYLSDFGKFLPVAEEEVKTYDINFTKLTDFIADQFNISENSRKNSNGYIDGNLFFLGEEHIKKKKYAIFFARRLNDQINFKKIDEFFLKESPTKFPKLILTSSNEHCPNKLTQKSKIISIQKLLTFSQGKLFNIDYISNILISGADDEYKPYVRCNEDASTFFVGNSSVHVKGDKQRQAIKIICDLYAENPEGNIRWNNVANIADFGTESRYRDLFKKSKVANFISYKEGIIEFKTEENS
jgi:hypothetical protein